MGRPERSRPVSTPSCLTSNTTAPGFGKGGTGVLSVDGKEVDSKKMPHTIPFLVSFDESFDVGVDTRYGVDDNDYQVPFRFTGKLTKLTIKLEQPRRTAEEERLLESARLCPKTWETATWRAPVGSPGTIHPGRLPSTAASPRQRGPWLPRCRRQR